MYRDESKNLLNSINWSEYSEYSNFFIEVKSAQMYDESTCDILRSNFTAILKPSWFSSGSFLYVVMLNFSNGYQNNAESDTSYEIYCADVEINNVTYNAIPISAYLSGDDLYDYSIRIMIRTSYITIIGNKTIPTSVLNDFYSVWLLAPKMSDILK